MTSNNLPSVRIVSDVPILHRAAFNVGPRITRVVVSEVEGVLYTCNYWHDENGNLVRIS